MSGLLRTIVPRHGRRSGSLADVACLLAIPCVGILDYVTGPEIAFSPFYLVPVGLAAWLGSRHMGLVASAVAAAAWLIADLLPDYYSHPAIVYWNGFVRLLVFAAVALLLARVRRMAESLKEKVTQRSAALAAEVQEHRLTRDALQSSEEQFRVLVEGVRECAIFMLDVDGIITSWNKGAEGLTGYKAHEVLGRHFSCLWTADERRQGVPADTVARALRDGAVEGEGWRVRRDGSRFWAATMLTALNDPAGRVRGFSKIIHDITNRKRMEDELLAKEEAERQRIGRDLHDVLGQDLAALALLSKDLEENLQGRSAPESAMAGRICRYAGKAVDQARRLAQGLCPPELQGDGLTTALEELALSTSEVFAVRCEVCIDQPVQFANAAAGLHLYRIAQEAVSNAVRHGKARRIVIHLAREPGQCVLRIEDDGEGVPQEPRPRRGMGISIMRHRARTIGGHLLLERRADGGTAVVCSVPVPGEQGDGPN